LFLAVSSIAVDRPQFPPPYSHFGIVVIIGTVTNEELYG